MNFIDKALEEITNGEDFVQAMADICYFKLVLNNDYESFWNRVYSYADKNIKSYQI